MVKVKVKVKEKVNYLKSTRANDSKTILYVRSVVFAYCKTLSLEKE